MPRLPAFRASRPDVAITLETDLLVVDTKWQDFDIWIAYSGGVGELCAMTAFPETVVEETLFPVGSPSLVERLGRPRTPADLLAWPLLYNPGWPTDWSLLFGSQGEAGPDLPRASGFRLFGMVLRAAVESMAAFVGRPSVVAEELEQGTLVPLFERRRQARARCCMVTAGDARRRDEVLMFRDWVLRQAAAESGPGPAATRRRPPGPRSRPGSPCCRGGSPKPATGPAHGCSGGRTSMASPHPSRDGTAAASRAGRRVPGQWRAASPGDGARARRTVRSGLGRGAARRYAHPAEALSGVGYLAEDALDVRMIGESASVQADAAGPADEKGPADMRLEHPNAVGDGSRGDLKFLGGAGKALMPRGGVEEAEAVEGRKGRHGIGAAGYLIGKISSVLILKF